MAGALVLLRHGLSTSNAAGEFTGWLDSPLAEAGRVEAERAGDRIVAADAIPDVVHTSLLSRAVVTADLVLARFGRRRIPVHRSWRLNERHYGALTGRNKRSVRADAGEWQYAEWRNSLHGRPPAMAPEDLSAMRGAPAHAALDPGLVPNTESLHDVTIRLAPYWADVLLPQVRSGLTVLVVSHGNLLRSLVHGLDDLTEEELRMLGIPTGAPLRYQFGDGPEPLLRGGEWL